MLKPATKAAGNGSLSDKDIQLLKKTYRKLTELYYENTKNQSSVLDLINFGDIITQVIFTKRESDALSITSMMEILKVKSKSRPDLVAHTDIIIDHLKNPKENPIKYQTLLYSLQKSELFVVGCTIAIRFYEKINSNTSQFDWKTIVSELSRNISINPSLGIELLYYICKENELHSRLAVKSGLVKFIFLSYISSTLLDKFNLYKSIKLLKVIATAERTLLKQREKSFALIIYTYEDYIPVIEEICSKCYDSDYGQLIDSKRKFDQTTIDQPYLWSYTEAFCTKNLSEQTIQQLVKSLQSPLNQQRETKTYAILSNFSKHRKIILKESLQILPKNQKSLLNYIKLCVNCCEIDHSSHGLIDLALLEKKVDNSPNPKVGQLFKYLKELKNKESKIGALSDTVKKMFDMQKNADFMIERASKIPQNNDQLMDIKQILKQKDRTNEFESDTLKTVKQRALNSLNTAIIQKKKLDLNPILKQIDLSDVKMLAKLLQILQLCLMINDDLIPTIDSNRVIEIIKWIEDNYNGELIEWGSIGQLIIILREEEEWKKHVNEIPEKCFWILGITDLNQQDEGFLFNRLNYIVQNLNKYALKVPLLIGFLGRVLTREQKLKLFKEFRNLFDLIFSNLKSNTNYKTNLLMISYFIKNWYSPEQMDVQSNKIFENIIDPLVQTVLSNFRSIEQQYEVLNNALPYRFKYGNLSDNLDYIISLYGRLASYIYKTNNQNGDKIALSYDRIKAVGRLAPEKGKNILQILKFLEQNSEIMQEDELNVLLNNLAAKKLVYWCAYPNFYNIISRIISILSKTSNPVLISNVSSILYKLIMLLLHNQDISIQQKNDLFQQVSDALLKLNTKGKAFIDKDKLKKAVEKIADQAIKEELLDIINNYNNPEIIQEVAIIVPPPQPSQQTIQKSTIEQPKPVVNEQKSPVKNDNNTKSPTETWDDLDKHEEAVDFDKHLKELESKQHENASGEMTIVQALRQLKKIIQKINPEELYFKLHDIFLKGTLKYEQMDILGHLLSKFYPKRPEKIQSLIINLLLMKDKTHLSKDSCYELLQSEKNAFVLSKRWKLIGRQWIDLAVTRLSQGFYAEASQVIEYNLIKTVDMQYFYAKKYHQVTLEVYGKLSNIDDWIYYLVLIGTSARLIQIKQYFIKDKLHIKILQAFSKFPQNEKMVANLSYALSALAYMQPEACIQIVRQREQMQFLLKTYKNQVDNKAIIEAGACLVANLAYSNEQIKQNLRLMNISEVMLSIFESTLSGPEISTFKQLLRALGNLSLSLKLAQELIDQHFCALACKMVEKLDIFVHFDQKKAALMKILIDLIANLAAHRYKLDVFHKEKLTLMILTLLETTQEHPPILMACIDTIDCLCQNSEIENYVVTEKKIPYLLIDILKIQTDEKIVVKSTRLLTNLTINQSCIPRILQANLLSVLANIVMPHFYNNRLAAEQNKKMETYVLKILTRIYHSKQSKQLILKSGYLDCLIRTIQTTDNIEDSYIEILYSYSEYLPSFLNKRAFICLIRVLTRKIQNKEITNKCLRTIKNLSNLYQKDEGDAMIQGTTQMYQKILTSDIKQDGLYLLALHLLRSHQLRMTLQKKKDHVLQIVKKLSQDAKYIDVCRQIFFIVYNPLSALDQTQDENSQELSYSMLKKGFKCNLYRIDGSSKKAIIDIDQQYELRSYKYPDGQIKKKYVIEIKNLKDYQFNYPYSDELWNSTVFNLDKGLFDLKKINPKTCCTLIGNVKWGEISFINVEFETVEDKVRFYRALSQIFNSVR